MVNRLDWVVLGSLVLAACDVNALTDAPLVVYLHGGYWQACRCVCVLRIISLKACPHLLPKTATLSPFPSVSVDRERECGQALMK